MLVYCSLCVCNLFIRAGNRGRWPASVKLVTLHYVVVLLFFRFVNKFNIVIALLVTCDNNCQKILSHILLIALSILLAAVA